MNNINLKEFEFDEKLLENVRLFDEVLSEFGEPPLLENPNFTISKNLDLSLDYVINYLILESTNIVKNSLPIRILFEGNDLRIDIARIPESFEWSREQINKDKNSVLEIIRNLLTGYVLIDERRSSKFIQIFNGEGDFINCQSRNNLFHMITGRFLFRFSDYRKLYLPLFKKK